METTNTQHAAGARNATERLVLQACRLTCSVTDMVARRDRALASQGRRAVQSMALQYAEGARALGGNRRAKLMGARSEAHEAAMALKLAVACGLVDEARVAGALDALDHVAATLWLMVHRPR